MKGKKILAFLMVMLLVVTVVVTLVACTDGNVNGTYYLFEDEKLQKDSFITLDGSTWKDDNGDSGSYSVNGKTITLFVEFMGEKEEFATGTVSDGVLTLKIMGADIVYCKEGKEPSSGGGNDKPPVTEKYTVTYDANGGTFTSGNSTLNQSDIASQSLLTAPSSPTRNGYNFGGWSKTKNKSDMWKFDTDKVTSNITLYAVWQQESAVILSMEGASIDGRSIFMLVNSDTVRVPLANKVVCSEDSIWRLYYDELGQMEIPTKIAASQNGALYNGENVFYIVVTSSNGSQVNVYELTIHRSYEVSLTYYDEGSVLHSTSIYTGNTLKESDLYSYDKTGYTFNSWKTSAGQKYVPGEVWSSLSLYADTTANDYTVTLNTNGGDELTNKTKTVTYDSGYTLPVPTKKGHAFDGWYLGSTKLSDAKGECINVWEYTSDKELTAKWIANRHSVTIDSNYATAGIIKGAGEYDYGTTIKITIAENKGYKYLGLYNGSTLITDKTEYSFTLDDNDVEYTAKFEPVAEMANFNFTATPTSCRITSVKDKTVKSITVPSYVTGYSDGAFYGCSALENITLPISNRFRYLFKDSKGIINMPKSLTTVIINGNKSIPEYAFEYCSGLTSVTIPDNVTSIGKDAFINCSGLTSVTIPNSVTSIGSSVFSGCTGLTSVSIGNSLTSIAEKAFMNCSALSSVTIPDSVKGIGNSAFNGCTGLTSVTIHNSVTSIGVEALKNCSALTSVTIPDSVTSIGLSAFYGCSSLTSVAIGNGMTSIGKSAFENCSSLASITVPFIGGSTWNNYFGFIFGASKYSENAKYVPNSLKEVIITGGESIGEYAFYNCSGLTSITIPDSVTSIGSFAFEGCRSLTSIIIPDSVTSIGEKAFYNCSGLTSVTIPDSVTSIGSSAFSGCSSLTSVTIPDSVTSIGSSAFSGCSSLTSVTIGNSVTSIGSYVFVDCSSLTSVTIGNSVTSIGSYVFVDCSSLTGITIGNSVTSIALYAFYNCNKISEVKYNGTIEQWCSIDGLDNLMRYGSNKKLYIGGSELTDLVIPDSVTSIGDYAFYGCTGLTNVTIGSAVTSIGSSAFEGCSGLTSVTIGSAVTSIGSSAFEGCSGLTSVTIGNSVTNIGDDAFYGCSSLISVTIPDSVTSIGSSVFYNCSSLTSVTIPDSVTSIGNYAFNGCSSLTSVTIPDSVTSIGSNAFYNCSGLTSITLSFVGAELGGTENTHFGYIFGASSYSYNSNYVPKSLKEVIITGGESIGDYAFEYCSGLTSVIIPNSVISIGREAFSGCKSLTNVTIGNSVTTIGYQAFEGCSGLTSVTIPNSVTSIGSSALWGCSNISEVKYNGTIEQWCAISRLGNLMGNGSNEKIYIGGIEITGDLVIPDGVTSIGEYAFSNCSSLTSITIPNSVTSIGDNVFSNCSGLTSVTIPNSVTSIGDNVFSGCSGLTSITIPNSVTSIGDNAFSGCSSLTSVTIPNSVKSIGSSAFAYCSGLTSVTIPDSVKSIGSSAFAYCSGLTSVTIPNSVTSIGDNVFSGCSGLTSITIPNSVTSIGDNAFSGCSSLTSVTFENTTGWFVYESWNATSGTNVDVTSPSQNAKYLKSTYYNYVWKRK